MGFCIKQLQSASVSFSFSENPRAKKTSSKKPSVHSAVNERGHNGQRVDLQKSNGGWEDADS
jgi:hypothetical protein